MAENLFNNIRKETGDSEKSYTWYREQIKKLGAVRPDTLFKNSTLTNRLLPGEMYLFMYDPKHKDTLPYYDMFPLVLPFRIVENGFYGINIHYLPYLIRFKLLGRLSELATDDNLNDKTRIAISWKILQSSSLYSPVNACVKHYLEKQLKSRFLKIPYPDWLTASQMPLEKFVGASKTQVWKDSQSKY